MLKLKHYKKGKSNLLFMEILESIKPLNDLLHRNGFYERIRSLFVASILIALKNGYEIKQDKSVNDYLADILACIKLSLKNASQKEEKLKPFETLLRLDNFKNINNPRMHEVLVFVKDNVYKELASLAGQDLLNIFFTAFNKYLGKQDKNQTFTPTHIVDFITDLANLNKNSIVLDPTCGSGAFLIQALVKIRKDKSNANLEHNIYGIEKDANVYGLTVANMLLHNDTQSQLYNNSCFDLKDVITNANINIILMNPPFNATQLPNKFYASKNGDDATKGLYFVKYVADLVNQGYLFTVLPYGSAIGNNKQILKIKEELLAKHTLKAVFSLPDDVFHPGASVASCIMVFELGKSHTASNTKTFFGYYKDDGFIKRKNVGRVPKIDWNITKKKWIDAYKEQQIIPGFSTLKQIDYNDDWLAEAYIDIDYNKLTEDDFAQTIRNYLAYVLTTQNK